MEEKIKGYMLYIYFDSDLIHSEYFRTYEEADKEAENYAMYDLDQVLTYDIQEYEED